MNDRTAPARCALVTRPRAQGVVWQQRLRALGARAELLPLIEIDPAPDPAALRLWFAALAAGGPFQPAALVMFVSPNAATGLFEVLPAGWRWPAGTLAAATGPGTVAALRAADVPAELIVAPPEDATQFDSEALWAVLEPRRDWAGQRVGIVRGDGGRDWLAAQLRAAGARVGFVQSYARAAPRLSADEQALLKQALAQPAAFAWLLSSSESIDHLPALAPAADWQAALALASHPRIAERARALGFGRVLEVKPTPEAVTQALGTLPA
ncbi:MAG TPA: uroporphyrinogen-III synthase [Ideonella sp.]|uniref:uroporphyrinogen-III synthase n=1 Tax=Ideonella sp. TaxID=1929293 RepID=UPI002E33D0EA|nr:uroporphyrinogen-III synthase [Ideonella sp.]HEX5685699.1 uroporphyrinogen-III synthase [Ideonella sp.]